MSFFLKKRSKRKLGRALLFALYAPARGFEEFSGNSLVAVFTADGQNGIPQGIPRNIKVMEKVNTIKYPVGLDVKLNSIVAKLGTNKRELLVAMVEYFYRTRKDPRDTGDELLKTTLNKNHKAYTGFIKSQENLLLIPIKEGVDRMIANQKDIVKYFNEQVLGTNRELLKNQQEQTQLLKEYAKREVERLKTSFLQLFDQYVQQREELGAFKGREREALADQFRKQVNKL